MERKEFISRSPSETVDIGEEIGRRAVKGDLFALYGDLGSGKTQLAKGIARGSGVGDWEYVVSPSFTLMNLYEGRYGVCHVDLYRIDGQDPLMVDVEEYRDGGIVVVEWAERGQWADGAIRITLEVLGENERRIVVERPCSYT